MVSVISSPLQAILWDVDGTLAETERDGHRLAFNAAFGEASIPLHWDAEEYGAWLAITGGKERIAAALQQLRGKAPAPEELARLQAAKQRHYGALVEAGALRLKPGVAALIAAANAAGLRQALVTTSGRSAVTALVRHCLGPLAEALELWVCGDDVERKKPDPQAYALALERLGLGPDAALAIEDTGQGLQAATAAGLGCVITLSHYGSREAMQRYAPALAVVEGFGPGGQVMVGPACGAAGVGLAYLQQLVPGRG